MATPTTVSVVRKAMSLSDVSDLSKLSLLPLSYFEKDSSMMSKRLRITDQKSTSNILVLCHNNQPINELQLGLLGEKNYDPLKCWSGASYYSASDKQYQRITNKYDVQWTKGLPRKENVKPTAKLALSIQLPTESMPDSQADLAKRFFEKYNELIIDAAISGVKLPEGNVHVLSGALKNATPDIVRNFFSSSYRVPTNVNPNTGMPYNPDLRVKIRIFLNEEKDKAAYLSTGTKLIEYNKDVANPDKPATSSEVDDCIDYFSSQTPVEGAWIVTFEPVEYKCGPTAIKDIYATVNLKTARVQSIKRDKDVNEKFN
jgi:hypothetical protein